VTPTDSHSLMRELTLDGRVALVTGAGRGIGRAIATRLAFAGAHVVVNDLTDEIVAETVAAIRLGGGAATACVGDVTSEDFPARMTRTALDVFGDIDIVVNNAGYSTYGDVIDTTDQQWSQMLEVLLTAPFRMLRAVGQHLQRTTGEGQMRKVVNVSSVGGITGAPGQAGYASAKAGLIALTRTLAKEWGPLAVTVNAVAPGLIRTRQSEGPAGGHDHIDVSGKRMPLVGVPMAALEPQIPAGRIGRPEDIANAVYLLCLPESDYITGEVIVVSGGWLP